MRRGALTLCLADREPPPDFGSGGPTWQTGPSATKRFRFTPEQEDVWRQRLNTLSRRDFDLYVDLGDGRLPIPSRAHLRGNGSISCGRKNYTLKLGERARAPGK